MNMKTKKALRILITPNVPCSYDQRMVKGLAEGFNHIGHHALLPTPVTPLSAEEIVKLCDSESIDVVLQINRTRDPNIPLPAHVRHISWYQDVFPETIDGFAETFHDSDILYSLGEPEVLGFKIQMPCYVSSLFTGVDQATLDFKYERIQQNIDLSLCGGLPGPVDLMPNPRTDELFYLDKLIGRTPLLGRSRAVWIIRKLLFAKSLPVDYVPYSALLAMRHITESLYRPLHGELDIHELADAMLNQASLFEDIFTEIPKNSSSRRKNKLSRMLKPYAEQCEGRSDSKARLIRFLAGESSFFQPYTISPIRQAISYFSQSYPRIMDRIALVDAASRVSKSLELYGPGLSAHAFAQPYLKGVLETQEELLDVYCRSKINLSNNTHGLGLHSRVLECMAVGGFIFMHESPHDYKVGGMLTAFEPGVHFGSYTPENFEEEAIRWLRDDRDRRRVGMRAQSVILEQHCWRHRAQQIIDDLNR